MNTESYFRRIFAGEVPREELKAYLIERADRPVELAELLGAAKAMREAAVRVNAPDKAVDIVGTGGDGLGTFNVSTTAAIIAASAGAIVAKHGNRASTSKSGSADCLAALGYNLDKTPKEVERDIVEKGIGFLFANQCHPAMRHVAPVRRELKFRTVFNLLGPLVNPAGVKRQALGVYGPDIMQLYAGALAELGAEHTLVFCGPGGLDELGLAGCSEVLEMIDGKVERKFTFDPARLFGRYYPIAEIAGGDAAANARITLAVLEGRECGAPRLAACLNAAAALVAGDIADTLETGFGIAEAAVDSGRALRKLEEMVK